MKFEVRKNDLSESIKKVLPFVGKFNNSPYIKFCVDKKRLTLIADNEQSFAECVVEISADEVFCFSINGNEINNIVDTFAKTIEFAKEENKLCLKENKSKMTLLCQSCDFNKIPKTNKTSKEIDFVRFKEAIKKTIDFVDNNVGVMSGINIKFQNEKTILQATNGTYGSICEYLESNNFEKTFILPVNVAKELIKIDDQCAVITFTGTRVLFEFETFAIETSTISGVYPKLEQLFTFGLNEKLEIDRDELILTLKKAQNIISKDKFILNVDIAKEAMKINIENQLKSLDEEIPCIFSGNEKKIKVNCELLPTVIKNCDNIVKIRFSEQNKMALYFENENNKIILMMCN